jgi:release factor glutamine methyltransferase
MTLPSTTVRDAITEASAHIPRRDAETLLLHLLHRDRAWLFAHPDEVLDETTLHKLRALTQRRAAHEPLQYLTGTQEFYGLALRVTRDTLIPRPETELLVEAVLSFAATLPPNLRIVDVGTGTGAIALALAAHLPQASVTACDISPAVLEVARSNAAQHGLTPRVAFLESDLLAALPTGPPFDIVVSNPPYVPLSDAPTLAPEVRDHEPHIALFVGPNDGPNGAPDGLDLYRRLIPQAHNALRPGGLLALEFGFGQRDALQALLTGWPNIRFLDDYAAIPRVALAQRP